MKIYHYLPQTVNYLKGTYPKVYRFGRNNEFCMALAIMGMTFRELITEYPKATVAATLTVAILIAIHF
jgi:hypothetical protein